MSEYKYTLVSSLNTVEKPEVSIIMPAIRQDKWDDVYKTILDSTQRSFELIVVGPYPLTKFLQEQKNVKYVKDFGSPMRASNIGAELCEGKLVMWTSDDGWFIKDALDKNIDTLYAMPYDVQNVVVARYLEGENRSGTDPRHGGADDSYYKLVRAYPSSPYIHPDWWIFNVAILYREFFDKLGAWDCKYQACPTGHADMAVRAQALGAKVVMSDYPMLNCDCQPNPNVGDHGPIVAAQFQDDYPIYIEKYSKPLQADQLLLDVSNWKKSPAVWKKRF